MKVLLVVPAYNEEDNIVRYVHNYAKIIHNMICSS